MPKYSHPDVLDNGIKYIKDNCDKVILISAYSTVYATVNGANKVAEVAVTTTDFSIAGDDGAARVLTAALAGKSGGNALQTVDPGTTLHLAFVDTVNSKVLHVTPENTTNPIGAGVAVNVINNSTYTANQPS